MKKKNDDDDDDDNNNNNNNRSSSHIKVVLVKLKALHPECPFVIVFIATIIARHLSFDMPHK